MVPKSVTLNDHERHNGHYFALFRRSFYGPVTQKWLISHQQIFCREMSWSTPSKHDGRAVLFVERSFLLPMRWY